MDEAVTDVIREWELKLTVRVVLDERRYRDRRHPFTPTGTEVGEAISEVLTDEESAIISRPHPDHKFDRQWTVVDIQDVSVGSVAGAPPGVIDEIKDAELQRRNLRQLDESHHAEEDRREDEAIVAAEERERRREQDDIAKHAEQRSVETDERN